jgi:GxxExxY protein
LEEEDTKTRSLEVDTLLDPAVERVGRAMVDSAFKVHSTLGPGLLESVYEACLRHELTQRALRVAAQLGLPLTYDKLKFDVGFRVDLKVEDVCIVEVKATEAILAIHRAELRTYLKLTRRRLGLLINFNVPLIRDGIKRVVL